MRGGLVSVDVKGITDMLTPLDARLTKNRGRGRPQGAHRRFLHLHPSYLRGNSHFAVSQGTGEIISSPCVQGAYCGLEDAARLWSSAVRSNSALARSKTFISLYNFPN